MANVPIVTEVTKAQLDALVTANGLNEGLQYKVTDKDWLLIATSNTSLISLTDILILSFNEELPSYLSAKTIYLDSGLIPTEGYETITPLDILFPADYSLNSFSWKNYPNTNGYTGDASLVDEDNNVLFSILSLNSGQKRRKLVIDKAHAWSEIISAKEINHYLLYFTTDTFETPSTSQFIFEFIKIPF